MTSSIMSIFDPCVHFKYGSIPIDFFILGLTFPLVSAAWKVNSGFSLILFAPLKGGLLNFSHKLATFVFAYILLVNIVGLTPLSYSPSSGAIFSFSLSLPLWLTSIIVDLKSNPINFVIHLVPEGSAPYMAIPLLWVELISLLMRPCSLAIRLLANVTAGHIVMCLVETSLSLESGLWYPVYFIMFMFLYLFEVLVSIIQAYVFSQLLTLYWSEIK